MKQKLSKNELITQFNTQLIRLKTFNTIFDSGDYYIAQDIAVKLRVLFHHSENNNSKSLLRQLKLEHIKFVDTGAKFNVNNLLGHWGLLILRATASIEKSEFIPKLDDDEFQYENFKTGGRIKKYSEG